MRMKDRVTITLDRDMIIRAKRMAHRRGTSLSGFVATSLQASLRERDTSDQNFSQRWAGKFAVRTSPETDPRLEALKAKHHLK